MNTHKKKLIKKFIFLLFFSFFLPIPVFASTIAVTPTVGHGMRQQFTLTTDKLDANAIYIWLDENESPVNERSDVAVAFVLRKEASGTYKLWGKSFKSGGNPIYVSDYQWDVGGFDPGQNEKIYINTNRTSSTSLQSDSIALLHAETSSYTVTTTSIVATFDIEFLPAFNAYQWLNYPWNANNKSFRQLHVFATDSTVLTSGNLTQVQWTKTGTWITIDTFLSIPTTVTQNGANQFTISTQIPVTANDITIWLDEFYPEPTRADVAIKFRAVKNGTSWDRAVIQGFAADSIDLDEAYHTTTYTWQNAAQIPQTAQIHLNHSFVNLFSTSKQQDSFASLDISTMTTSVNGDRVTLTWPISVSSNMPHRLLSVFVATNDSASFPSNFYLPQTSVEIGIEPTFVHIEPAPDKKTFVKKGTNDTFLIKGVNEFLVYRQYSEDEQRGVFAKYRLHGLNTIRVFLYLNRVIPQGVGVRSIWQRPVLAIDAMMRAAEYTGMRLYVMLFDVDYIAAYPQGAHDALSFALNRWSTSPAILMWDLNNDFETGGVANYETTVSDLVSQIKTADPYKRPVGIQFHSGEALLKNFPGLYSLIDFGSVRFYDYATFQTSTIQNCFELNNVQSGLPFFITEELANMTAQNKPYPLFVGETRLHGDGTVIPTTTFSTQTATSCVHTSLVNTYQHLTNGYLPWQSYVLPVPPWPRVSEGELDMYKSFYEAELPKMALEKYGENGLYDFHKDQKINVFDIAGSLRN